MKTTVPGLTSLCLACLLLPGIPARGEMREFTDAQGRKLKAELLSHNGAGELELKREDGKVFKVPAATFSLDDQSAIKDWIAKNPVQLAYRFDVKVAAEKVGGSRQNLGYKKVKNEIWTYKATVKNLSRDTVSNLKVQYRVFAINSADGSFSGDLYSGYYSGEAALKGPYRYNEQGEFHTMQVPIDVVDYEFAGGRYKDGLQGFMMRILDQQGKVVTEYILPTGTLKNETWDSITPKSKEIKLPTP